MYSWEINDAMCKHNFVLPSKIYWNIVRGSPQLTYVGYDIADDMYDLYDGEGNHWRFEISEENL